MRKSLWIVPFLLLSAAICSTTARADTIVASGGNVTAINGITIAGITYNVTFGTTIDTTFAGNPTNANAMNTAIVADLSSSNTDLTAGRACLVGLDGGVSTYGAISLAAAPCGFPGAPAHWVADTFSTVGFTDYVLTGNGTVLWDEFAVAATTTPEPGTLSLTLTGLGLLGLLVVIRKRVALRHPQAT